MNKNVEIPYWIGKFNAPEDTSSTMELLQTFSDIIEEPMPEIEIKRWERWNKDVFLVKACDITNNFMEKIKDVKLPEMGVWTGFPETPIGRFNAQLGATVWLLKRALEEKDG
jgi:hypothetical protein